MKVTVLNQCDFMTNLLAGRRRLAVHFDVAACDSCLNTFIISPHFLLWLLVIIEIQNYEYKLTNRCLGDWMPARQSAIQFVISIPLSGRHVSHTIDPRTGRPIKHNLAYVTVVHKECAVADALATALTVLGPEGPHRLLRSYFLNRLTLQRSCSQRWPAHPRRRPT
ncbi:MAG: FAD:protein FMN transferase [Deltaproteobacteria bacterium]|nr:FAD:protein FMN transferase [Deltaproteobacteria bacterium]